MAESGRELRKANANVEEIDNIFEDLNFMPHQNKEIP